MIWWLSPLSWLLPGSLVALAVSVVASGRAARWLGAPRPVAWLLLLSAGVILAGTVTPLDADVRPVPGLTRSCDLSRIGLAPLRELRWPSDVTGNILAFIPLGFAIALAPRSRRKAAVLVAALALPLAVEATQLLATALGRACQSADVVDNLTGLILGLVAGAVVARVLARNGAGPGSGVIT